MPVDPTPKIAAALAAVRELAETPGATGETWQLLQCLEAHLGVPPGVPPLPAAGAPEPRATSSTSPR